MPEGTRMVNLMFVFAGSSSEVVDALCAGQVTSDNVGAALVLLNHEIRADAACNTEMIRGCLEARSLGDFVARTRRIKASSSCKTSCRLLFALWRALRCPKQEQIHASSTCVEMKMTSK